MNRALRRKQLDRQIEPLSTVTRSRPARGWSTAVRQSLGMSTRQLGDRLGVTQQAAADLERSEQTGSITLKNLARLAEALDSQLYYAFLPRTSFETILGKQAERLADQVVSRVESSMSLEDQSTATESQRQRKADLAAEYVRTTPRDLWDLK